MAEPITIDGPMLVAFGYGVLVGCSALLFAWWLREVRRLPQQIQRPTKNYVWALAASVENAAFLFPSGNKRRSDLLLAASLLRNVCRLQIRLQDKGEAVANG